MGALDAISEGEAYIAFLLNFRGDTAEQTINKRYYSGLFVKIAAHVGVFKRPQQNSHIQLDIFQLLSILNTGGRIGQDLHVLCVPLSLFSTL